MFRPICKNCSDENGRAVFMRVVRVGIKVRFGYYNGYFHADLYQCPVCGHEIIMGFGNTEVFDGVPDYDYGEDKWHIPAQMEVHTFK